MVDTCHGCNKPISGRFFKLANGAILLHDECFVCGSCRKDCKGGFFWAGDKMVCSDLCKNKEEDKLKQEFLRTAPPRPADSILQQYHINSEGCDDEDLVYLLRRAQAKEQAELGEDAIVARLPPGQMFEDPTFPADPSSLNRDAFVAAVWRRPSQFCPDPANARVFRDDVEPGDVMQGGLGDCWFLSALSILALKSEYLKKILVSDKHSDRGIYTFRFFKDEEWQNVIVDDRIPCNGMPGTPIYSRCRDPNELWLALIEKAYAKLHGTYARLEGGSTAYGLRDLCAGAPMTLDINENLDGLWDRINYYLDEGFLTGCSLSGGTEVDQGSGILSGHAYGILDAVELPGYDSMIKIRNPWGRTEWKGKYCDADPFWNEETLKKFNHTKDDDGTWYMSFPDFVRNFSAIQVCRLGDDDWTQRRQVNFWEIDRGTAGGCINNGLKSWLSNPQFHLMSPVDIKEAFLLLTSLDSRLAVCKGQDTWREKSFSLGFTVIKSPEFGVPVTNPSQDDKHVSTKSFVPGRAVGVELSMEANQPYVIIPSTFEKNQNGPFTIVLYCKCPESVMQQIRLEGGHDIPDIGEIDESNPFEPMVLGDEEQD